MGFGIEHCPMLLGYRRPCGRHGIRNHLAVIPASVCAAEVSIRIASGVKGAVALPHSNGCCQMGEDYSQTARTLIGMGRNPNVGAVLVVGLGCEGMQPKELVEGIAKSGKPVELIVIQDCGGTEGALQSGIEKARMLADGLKASPMEPFPLSELAIGLECGGSDPTSGIAANPSLGVASDMIIEAGGISILSETTELIGAESILAGRAKCKCDGDKLLKMVADVEKKAADMGADLRGTQPTPGNIKGGLTTIEEKSLGCILKAGSPALMGVLSYAEGLPGDACGLYFMDTPGQDVESMTGMLAGGAHLIVFTTGLGTPTGTPIAPVIKITANAKTFNNMSGNIDIDLSPVMEGKMGIVEAGAAIFDEIVAVSMGKLTKSEITGHREFGICRIGPTF